MLEELKTEVLNANRRLQSSGLVKLTWGNVSGIDRSRGLVVIKPSGVAYDTLNSSHLVVLDLEGNVVEGDLNPSSDTPTHIYLYNAFEQLGGITHTHSEFATMMCQMGKELPCSGTTHADHFCGTVPLIRPLSKSEVDESYERNTGVVIAQSLRENDINPLEIPAVLQHYHAPFTFGKTATEAFNNAIALESCCQMAVHSLAVGDLPVLPAHILQKHYQRKHGKNAAYGQKNKPS
jgi:L-ribulose-5-phosphate 4-epimerase